MSSRVAYFITQPAGMARISPEAEDALRTQIRDQMKLEVPVVILPAGCGVVEVEACEASGAVMANVTPKQQRR